MRCSLVLLAAIFSLTSTGFAADAPPTFTKDVAPIIYSHCASCHRPGDIAPMSLLSYEDVRPWAKSIREKVGNGDMPPWHSIDAHGIFSNDRRLNDKDKDTLLRWAAAGAPKGDAKDQPPAPKFAEGWEIGKPDVVLTMEKAYEVPATGTIAYQMFQLPTNFTEDKWVQAIEIRPGVRAVVHHVLAFCREPGSSRTVAYKSVVPVRPDRPGQSERGNEDRAPLIASTAPGTNAMTYSDGQAMLVRAGATVILQIHYTSNGTAAKDRTSVGFIFAKQPPQVEVRNGAFTNPTLVLPAGSNNQEVDSAIEFTQDSHIEALLPHTHLRGKSWEYRMVYPDGRSEVVLSVPKYDFNWQTYYIFAKPLAAPKGSRLEARAHYDNSTANKSNPDPTVTVKWGPQTWEEMQYTGITYTIDAKTASVKLQ